MQLISALRRLWRHAAFRRLLTLRILSQAADGTLQVGMASYILFSPQSQASAWAIGGVLALTLLPFTVIGPFVSPLLDRWSRRNVALYSDLTRAVLAATIGVIIATGATTGGWAVVLFGALLVAMSINRFMLAGLSAGLQHTVEQDEYLTASSIVPTVGPIGVVIGAVAGFAARFALGDALGANRADAMVFGLSAVMFVGSVLVCRGFHRDALGPAPVDPAAGGVGSTVVRRRSTTEVVAGLADAARHLRTRPVALLALLLMAATRLLFGLLSVAVILAARHLWHPSDRPELALADLTVWGLATGAGFILSAPVVPVMVRWLGLRRTSIAVLLLGTATSAALAISSAKPVVFVTSFFVGLAVQAFKVCVDTIVQSHVEEQYKGRVFTFYDMFFNAAFVTAGVVAAFVLPTTGLSTAAFVGIGVGYVACAAVLFGAGARLGHATFERGTEDLTRAS
ncbi:MFS transporter [Tessaracoccus sp. MC1865]|uniref:MFS transporter n=1 Tax=Tessaracoccus sp. MC1865 TaxID=2760310 RepID=UPI0015FFA747|nr:MFS transporter [Tessaracoccus sp. MC1865]MBB1482983.1 MFS transporter [Tessaracoccus sp. MC1865]QTO37580.1 MFS transporter [Tessaracoccus sp. MC1865]